MKAQLQIGNEMREGSFNYRFMTSIKVWYWTFRPSDECIWVVQSMNFLNEHEAIKHFKSIGGIILGDAE